MAPEVGIEPTTRYFGIWKVLTLFLEAVERPFYMD
jgi:hypothetical protein